MPQVKNNRGRPALVFAPVSVLKNVTGDMSAGFALRAAYGDASAYGLSVSELM